MIKKTKLTKQSHLQLLKKKKYLVINLTKEVKALDLVFHYKTLKKEIEDTNK